MKDLTDTGVTFEQYGLPGLRTDERGIVTLGSVNVVLFKGTPKKTRSRSVSGIVPQAAISPIASSLDSQ